MVPSNPSSRTQQILSRYKPLSEEDEIRLNQARIEGNAHARDVLILSNLRLVMSIAYRWAIHPSFIEDLISAGVVGLIKAVDRFDHSTGRLASFARWHISRAVAHQAFTMLTPIRIPHNIVPLIPRIRNFLDEYQQTHNRAPSAEIVAKQFAITKRMAHRLIKIIDIKTVPIDLPASGNSTDGFQLEDQHALSPREAFSRQALLSDLNRFIDNVLPPRDAEIIRLRYGISRTPETCHNIGQRFGVSSTRIRQIENKFLRIIRSRFHQWM